VRLWRHPRLATRYEEVPVTTRRVIAAVAVTSMLVAAVAAAGSIAASRSGHVTSLKVWVAAQGYYQPTKDQFKRFTKATGIKLDVQVFPNPFEQNVLAKWATGDRPDILFFHAIGNWLVQLNPSKNLIPLDNEPFVKRTIPGLLNKAGSYHGHKYAAVLNYPFIDGMFYNRQVFKRYGLKVPRNYAEVVRTCKQIKEKAPDIAPIYMGGGDQWPLQVLAFMMWNDAIKNRPNLIAGLNTNKVKFTNPAFVWGIQAEKNLQNMGCLNSDILTANYEGEQKSLMGGKAAMVFQGTWFVQGVLDSYGLKKVNATVGFAGVSRSTGVVSWQTVGVGNLYLPKTGDAEREAAAKKFIDFATGRDYRLYIAQSHQFPVLLGFKKPAGVARPLQVANTLFLKNSVPQYQQTLQAAYGPFETFLQEMIAGKKTAKDVAQNLQDEFEKSARQIGLPGFGF
jgi:raffinose/stachyose/melibiose transport system substrate-binding protein